MSFIFLSKRCHLPDPNRAKAASKKQLQVVARIKEAVTIIGEAVTLSEEAVTLSEEAVTNIS